MAHKYQKRWVFTWNFDEDHGLPPAYVIQTKLDDIASEAVFQLEKGEQAGRHHYQGRFVLKGPRMGKRALLKLFDEIFYTKQLTLIPELSYDSTSYCEKSETRLKGPWYAGLHSYKILKEEKVMTLRNWQEQLLKLMTGPLRSMLEDRKVIWIEDPEGGNGKSTFIKYLALNEKKTGLAVEKMPFDRPDRIRSSVIKLSKKKDVDVYMFDFTRTQGEETSFKDLFEVIEEIKNGYIVDVMYGNFNKAFPKDSIVIIFTNENVNHNVKHLSIDRWEPFRILDDNLVYRSRTSDEFNDLVPFEQYLFTRLENHSND
jgi:hypothetical protein